MIKKEVILAKTHGFYQYFNLNLQRLSGALACIQESPTAGRVALANCMGVNRPVADGFSGWLLHTGLASAQKKGSLLSYELTAVGALIAEHDQELADLGTQWLLHYHLATEQQERSDAWHVLFNQYLSPGMTFTSEGYQSYFARTIGDGVANRTAVKKDPLAALFTYRNHQALASLGLLTKQKKKYVVQSPDYPNSLVIGYMLLDWWKRHYDYSNTLRFSQLCQEEESLGRLCLATPSQVRRFVVELTAQGYLTFSDTQHEPVNRLYNDDPHRLLERYYESL